LTLFSILKIIKYCNRFPFLQLCKKELYGDTADEKEVDKIVSKLKEAKGVKAFNTLQIIAKNVSQSSLLRLIVPFKDVS
jgi:U3 small nucleolar RNA-associated protein 20